jgi:hypothetical protein
VRPGVFGILEWMVHRRDACLERVGKALELRPAMSGEFEGHREGIWFQLHTIPSTSQIPENGNFCTC